MVNFNKPIITSIPSLNGYAGVPYFYQVTAITGSDDPIMQLRLTLMALSNVLVPYDQSVEAIMTQLIQVRDVINIFLEGITVQ